VIIISAVLHVSSHQQISQYQGLICCSNVSTTQNVPIAWAMQLHVKIARCCCEIYRVKWTLVAFIVAIGCTCMHTCGIELIVSACSVHACSRCEALALRSVFKNMWYESIPWLLWQKQHMYTLIYMHAYMHDAGSDSAVTACWLLACTTSKAIKWCEPYLSSQTCPCKDPEYSSHSSSTEDLEFDPSNTFNMQVRDNHAQSTTDTNLSSQPHKQKIPYNEWMLPDALYHCRQYFLTKYTV
jgi:hypothetical protein